MTSIDINTKIRQQVAVNGTEVTTTANVVGNIIDTQFYESLSFLVYTGVYTTGDLTLILEDGEDAALSDAAAVNSDFIIGDLTAITLGAANQTARVGYVGKKRYVRLTIVPANTPVFTTGSLNVLSDFRHQPTPA